MRPRRCRTGATLAGPTGGRQTSPRVPQPACEACPGRIVECMCRNITVLRGLQPSATAEEIEAAARQYIRKVSGVQAPGGANSEQFEAAVAEVAAVTARLLDALPPRRRPPATVPPLRRPEVRARIAAREAARG